MMEPMRGKRGGTKNEQIFQGIPGDRKGEIPPLPDGYCRRSGFHFILAAAVFGFGLNLLMAYFLLCNLFCCM